MEYRELGIEGAWEVTPRIFADARGAFLESFRLDSLGEAIGHPFHLAQANSSISAAGTIRGIHFAEVPPGQAKYVMCARGAILDVVVDIRIGSPTFGHWEGVPLDDVDRRAVYLSEGLGHAFMALEDDTTVVYLCSAPYAPTREHGIHALDPTLGILWPTVDRAGAPVTPLLSDKDATCASLDEVAKAGLLPTLDVVTTYRRSL